MEPLWKHHASMEEPWEQREREASYGTPWQHHESTAIPWKHHVRLWKHYGRAYTTLWPLFTLRRAGKQDRRRQRNPYISSGSRQRMHTRKKRQRATGRVQGSPAPFAPSSTHNAPDLGFPPKSVLPGRSLNWVSVRETRETTLFVIGR